MDINDTTLYICKFCDIPALRALHCVNKKYRKLITPLFYTIVRTVEFTLSCVTLYVTQRIMYNINHTISTEIVYNNMLYGANIYSKGCNINGVFSLGAIHHHIRHPQRKEYICIKNNIVSLYIEATQYSNLMPYKYGVFKVKSNIPEFLNRHICDRDQCTTNHGWQVSKYHLELRQFIYSYLTSTNSNNLFDYPEDVIISTLAKMIDTYERLNAVRSPVNI